MERFGDTTILSKAKRAGNQEHPRGPRGLDPRGDCVWFGVAITQGGVERCVLDRTLGSSKKFKLYLTDQGHQTFFFGKGPDSSIFWLCGSYSFCLNYSMLHCNVEAAMDDM